MWQSRHSVRSGCAWGGAPLSPVAWQRTQSVLQLVALWGTGGTESSIDTSGESSTGGGGGTMGSPTGQPDASSAASHAPMAQRRAAFHEGSDDAFLVMR